MSTAATGNDFVIPNASDYAKGGLVHLIDEGWSPLYDRIRLGLSTPSEKDIRYPRNRQEGTNCGSKVRVMPLVAQRDTFVDNELGETIHKTKVKFGRAPFIEAYKRALNTSKEINDRRKKCLEEEFNFRSVLGAGED